MDTTNKLKAEIRDRRTDLEKRKLQLENELDEELKKNAARIAKEKTTTHDQKP